jgi:Uma2 family endonuclease
MEAQTMSQPIDTSAAAHPAGSNPRRMTYDEFLRDPDVPDWAEWVDGEVIELSPAMDWHQNLADFLAALFRHFCEAHGLGEVRSAPFQMKLPRSGREPDVLFVAREHRDRLRETHLEGPADLAIEVINPDSRTRDRKHKFREYEEAGVREYWLVDRQRKQAEVYVLDAEGKYRLRPAEEGVLRSVVLEGLWLKAEWLWLESLPPLMSVLRAWGLVS